MDVCARLLNNPVDRILQESEQRYKSLVQYNPDGICGIDAHCRFIEGNIELERILGYSAKELQHMSLSDVLLTEDVEWAEEVLHTSLRGELRESMEIVLRHKSGRRVDVSLKHAPIIINDEVVGVYAVVRYITEEKQTREGLRRSESFRLWANSRRALRTKLKIR
jgi:PAS domain S-box-containing protein